MAERARPSMVCIDYQALAKLPRADREAVLRAHLAGPALRVAFVLSSIALLVTSVLAAEGTSRAIDALCAVSAAVFALVLGLDLRARRLRARFAIAPRVL